MGSQDYDDSVENKDDAIEFLKKAQGKLALIISMHDIFFHDFSEESQFDIVVSMQDIQEVIKRLS